MQTCEKISAGGVAYRMNGTEIEIALIKTSSEGRWQLPKGIIDPGETAEIAALREVREEAGIDCELLQPIDVIDYWFVDRHGVEPIKTHKFVHFFLMKYLSGNVADHDDEVVEARWSTPAEAAAMLEFEVERKIVKTGLIIAETHSTADQGNKVKTAPTKS
ncbi:MAG: NUDIX hydrolase [Pyrinomonadaceae bacterium]